MPLRCFARRGYIESRERSAYFVIFHTDDGFATSAERATPVLSGEQSTANRHTVPTFEQLVLARLIENGDFERHINRHRRRARKQNAQR